MYKVVNKKGKNVLGETFRSKVGAEQAIVDMIKGSRAKSLIYYKTLSVRKAK